MSQLITWEHNRQAWEAGWHAGNTGSPEDAIPYPVGTVEAKSWSDGWVEGNDLREGRSYYPCCCDQCQPWRRARIDAVGPLREGSTGFERFLDGMVRAGNLIREDVAAGRPLPKLW